MSNDDMFFLVSSPSHIFPATLTDQQNPLSTSDFHHPLLGPVLRMAPQLPVQPILTPDLLTSHGEWGGLQHASALLSRRFTNRPQAYPEHFPKSLTLEMMDEASIMFGTDLAVAATRGFRESKRGTADLEMAALASWLRIERWREALLWTWVVGKVGGSDGLWGEGAREELRELFGTGLEEGRIALVRKGVRKTVQDADRYLISNNLDEPLRTRIRFCKSTIALENIADEGSIARWASTQRSRQASPPMCLHAILPTRWLLYRYFVHILRPRRLQTPSIRTTTMR